MSVKKSCILRLIRSLCILSTVVPAMAADPGRLSTETGETTANETTSSQNTQTNMDNAIPILTIRTFTPQSSQTLQEFLEDVINNSSVKTARIQLLAGKEYEISRCITFYHLSHLDICNVERNDDDTGYVESEKKARIVFTGCANRDDDTFISVKDFRSVYIRNVDFSVKSSIVAPREIKHFLKCRNGNEVRLENTGIDLDNGALTCLNVRETKNTALSGCVFSNNVQRATYTINGVKIGGIFWISGSFDSLEISGCRFSHDGADEFIALMPTFENVPDSYEHHYRNVDIRDNEFVYGSATTSVPNDKVIAFLNDDNGGNHIHSWENVYIGHNRFRFNYPVRNLLVVDNINNVKTFRNVKFEGNDVSSSGGPVATRITDIFAGSGPARIAPIEDRNIEPLNVLDNTFSAGETLSDQGGTHYFVRVDGASVFLRGNIFDASGISVHCPSGGYGEPTSYNSLLKADSRGGQILATANTSKRIGLLGTLAEPITIARTDITLLCNRLDYHQGFYCNNLSEFNLTVQDNFMNTSGWYILAHKFGKTGSLDLSENFWAVDSTPSKIYKTPESVLFWLPEKDQKPGETPTPPEDEFDLSYIRITDNVFRGINVIVEKPLPKSQSTTVENNSYSRYRPM